VKGSLAPARQLSRFRWTARSHLAERRVYLPIARRRYGHMVVDGSTAMLIDGFTRSACVYAAVAFQLSQPRPVRLAHLIHSPAHIIEGVRRNVPCLVTVREPRGASRRRPRLWCWPPTSASTGRCCRTGRGWWWGRSIA
jgi:hypothetical protein